jgi:hypothetical protein
MSSLPKPLYSGRPGRVESLVAAREAGRRREEASPITTITELNDATEAALAARTAEAATEAPATPATVAPAKAAKAARTAGVKATVGRKSAKAPAPPAPPAPPVRSGRTARTPRERAALPPTGTIAAYVDFLAREVFDGKTSAKLPGVTGPGAGFGKLTARERAIAALSITLYGAYQASPERRAARGF